jgi:site-specific recombinase XerD
MSATEFFTFPRTHRRLYAGPLGPHIDEFTDHLKERGYSISSIRTKLRAVASFSRWLKSHNLGPEDVDAEQVKRFLAHRKRVGRRIAEDAAALREIAALLREQGLTRVSNSSGVLSDHERAAHDFKLYLLQKCGLSGATVRAYLPFVSRFLSECLGDEPVRLEALTSSDVTGYVQRHAHGYSHSRAQLVVKALRAFLRYLYRHGRIRTDLAACVPSVAAWSFSRLPAFLRPDQLEQVLAQCDRKSATGRRDYAMLLLFARLGLRAAEVAALRLDEIDWQSGCLAIRNKGGRWTQMPLPQDVGEAIADYLANARPSCTDRHVFIRDHAPRTGFTNSTSVSAVASRALARAGIDFPRKGAHLFRHNLATEMLRQGASLTEIGQLLRHQHPDTTRIYAKVDLAALRELAPPWPGGAR